MATFPVGILAGAVPKVSQGFGGGSGNHKGNDVMYRRPERGAQQLPVYSPNYYMPNGVPALAFMSGRVTRASMIGTGGRVRIDHGGGLESAYYHLRKPGVSVGQNIGEGSPVGIIYHNTSAPTATRTPYKLNHLHFEIFKNGVAVDPAPYLANAQKIDSPPNQAQFALKVGVAIVAGLLINKYVFK